MAARKTSYAELVRSIEELHRRWGRSIFAPPMNASDVAALERRVGVKLPEEYTRFLLEVSAGQLDDPQSTGRMETPERALAIEPPEKDTLVLRDQGDAQYDGLRLRGEHAGEIWHAWDGGFAPQKPKRFAAWIARHVDELVKGAPKPIDEGATKLGAELAAFTEVPPIVARMTKLEELSIDRKKIDGPLPTWLARNEGMRAFTAASCGVTELGEWIGAWKDLRTLSLVDNRLRALPEAIGACASLETLLLQGNQIEALPRSMRALRAMRDLELGGRWAGVYLGTTPRFEGGNGIEAMEDDLFAETTELRALRLSKNPLRRLPTSIARCPLEILELADMPNLDADGALRTIATLPTLKKLMLSGTRITREIPDLSSLVTLEWLRLGDTGVRAVPGSIRAMRALQWLDVGGNGVEEIPDFVAEMPALKSITVRGMEAERCARLQARFPKIRIVNH